MLLPLCLLLLPGADGDPREKPAVRADVLLVVGAAGAERFGAEFADWAARWEQAAGSGGFQLHLVGGSPESAADGGPSGDVGEQDDAASDRESLAAALRQQIAVESRPLWIVMIGHGTFDGRDARFNLRGPDVTDSWLAEQLAECRRPLAVLLCFSSSAPFLNRLSGDGRAIVSATKSGFEQNYSRFGGQLAAAVADAEGDLDKDGQTSLLEAFLLASKRTVEFYASENRLATEQALLDDNGDGKGTPADWFHGVRPVKAPKDGELDGLLANQLHLVPSKREQNASPEFLAARDELEREINELRKQRSQLGEDQYLRRLEPLMIRLARLYAALDGKAKGPQPPRASPDSLSGQPEATAEK